ncbi:MAG: relaxase/mobilization nuclease domain-containing protein [Steroidobacteraceae bacterium]
MKVLSKGGSDLMAVARHFDSISRQGDRALEGDEGWELNRQTGNELVEDWDLDIDELRPQMDRIDTRGSKPMKRVHKLVFSMPESTPPQKVLSAVRDFAREEFYGQHRYAMVLHTAEPHPHVHLVLRALSDEGKRLNIKKATLRHWRAQWQVWPRRRTQCLPMPAHHHRQLEVLCGVSRFSSHSRLIE